jgi:endonuclease/exonuclease/phosphatase family metal-dependent hydrolase
MFTLAVSVRVVSYNVLADGYLRSEHYRRTPTELLDPARRHPALAARIAALDADVVCVQEAEPQMLLAIAAALPRYEQRYVQRPGRLDGVAILTRKPSLEEARVVYADTTSRVALLVAHQVEGRRLGVAATHLKFDAPGEAFAAPQAEALLDAVAGFRPACDAWVLAGDFNATPESAVLERMRSRGFRDVYEGRRDPTCNFAGGPKRIDFVMVDSALDASPLPVSAVDRETVLPSRDEPSDHVPVGADLRFRSG